MEELRVLSARIMKVLKEAPKIPDHPYHSYEHPASWEDVKAAMPASVDTNRFPVGKMSMPNGYIRVGWVRWLVVPLVRHRRLYRGRKSAGLRRSSRLSHRPETTNDDVVYELLLLDVYEKMGKGSHPMYWEMNG